MLLVETLNIDDEALRRTFDLVVPMEDPDLESKIDTRERKRSGMTTEVNETLSPSGTLTEVRILYFLLLHNVLTNFFRLQSA